MSRMWIPRSRYRINKSRYSNNRSRYHINKSRYRINKSSTSDLILATQLFSRYETNKFLKKHSVIRTYIALFFVNSAEAFGFVTGRFC